MFVVRLGEVCSHVAAILVAVEQCVEQCVREGLNAPSVTSEPCVWSRINKKVHAIQCWLTCLFYLIKITF